MNECQEDLENAIKGADFQQAALLKDQIADLQSQKNSLLDEMGNSAEVNGTQRVERVSKFSSIPVLPRQTLPQVSHASGKTTIKLPLPPLANLLSLDSTAAVV